MNIIDYMPCGQKNAITRAELSKITGLKDRVVRELIGQARRETPILNTQNGEGYFIPLPSEKHLVERWLKQEESRAKSIFWSIRGAKNFIKAV